MLIELRIMKARSQLKSLIKKYGLVMGARTVEVPHATVYSGFRANREQIKKIMECIRELTDNRDSFVMPIEKIEIKKHPDGQGYFGYFEILPTEELLKFRENLCMRMQRIAPSKNYFDKPGSPFLCHISIACHLPYWKATRIKEYIRPSPSLIDRIRGIFGEKIVQKNREAEYRIALEAYRITLLSDRGRIIFEYDLPRKIILPRSRALMRSEWIETFRAVRRKKEGIGYIR